MPRRRLTTQSSRQASIYMNQYITNSITEGKVGAMPGVRQVDRLKGYKSLWEKLAEKMCL